MSTPARVRFAPSPTGYLHVGSIRSGLFNWLWARHTGGSFVLRIEDTDRARLVPDAIDQINDSLEALGIAPDEGPRQGGKYGPYLQSQRLDLYQAHADELVESGALYRCWCTPERLDGLRTAAQKAGTAFKYDRHCLIPTNQLTTADPFVLRFMIPETPAVVAWEDAVRGHMEFKITELDDFVAVKTDGYPTYHFANVVDDHLMDITHVLRADEWLPSTPKHLLMFAAFGWDAPTYAHLPPVQGPDGKKKLSKRDGAQSVGEYIEEGYLPEALMSFLASLGWNDGTTQEVYSPAELIHNFSLDRIQKSPAMFDKDRLTWINGLLIRQMAPETLLKRSEAFWPTQAVSASPAYLLAVLGLVQERLKFLAELPELTDFFFTAPTLSADQFKTTVDLDGIIEKLGNWTGDFTAATVEPVVREWAATVGDKPGPTFMVIRIALTGKTATPGLFETMEVLGRENTLARLTTARDLLNR
jgi:glutamyl-tRNA synthetase